MWRNFLGVSAAVVFSAVLAGCGGAPFTAGDAVGDPPDSGAGTVDSGCCGDVLSPEAGQDSQPTPEAGQDSNPGQGQDSGSCVTCQDAAPEAAPQDSGHVETDSGSSNHDSGTDQDSGTPDSGTVLSDSGTTSQDSGTTTPDSGTGCSTGETLCNGSCQPGVCVLASGLSHAAVGLAVNTEVYWSDFVTSALNTVALDGASNPSTLTTAYVPKFFAATLTNAVWTDGSNIVRTTPAGVSTVLFSGGQSISGIAVDSQNVYWTDTTAGTVSQLAIGTSNVVPLAAGQNSPDAIAIDSSFVYWTNSGDGSVKKTGISGASGIQTIATGSESWILGTRSAGIAVDATGVYWTTTQTPNGAVTKCPLNGCGSSPTWQVPGQDNAWNIVVNGTSVYWTNPGHNGSNGSVVSIPVTGGSLTTIASGLNTPYGIALDTASVYWADATTISKHTLL